MAKALKRWQPGDVVAARKLHFAAEPRSQAIIRALNRVPGATARLVQLGADLLSPRDMAPEPRGLDLDFRHLFSCWFNRGFLEIRHIEWSTSAAILEKIIRYEAVHEIKRWADLRQRVAALDRRLFAFFHPAMPDEPLIFVEVALTASTPHAIAPILASDRDALEPEQATTVVLCSIPSPIAKRACAAFHSAVSSSSRSSRSCRAKFQGSSTSSPCLRCRTCAGGPKSKPLWAMILASMTAPRH